MKFQRNICLIVALSCCLLPRVHAAAPAGAKREIRGEPIRPLSPALPREPGSNFSTAVPLLPPLAFQTNAPGPGPGRTNAAGFVDLGFDTLGGFAYDITNVYSDEVSGRAQTKPLNDIPKNIRAYDGMKISITGYVMPMRMRGGRVTEFLLVRDQAACCFGGTPQINHWIRVKMKGEGIDADYEPQIVSGTLRVGEKYEQGYLTGIYTMEADTVHVAPDSPR